MSKFFSAEKGVMVCFGKNLDLGSEDFEILGEENVGQTTPRK